MPESTLRSTAWLVLGFVGCVTAASPLRGGIDSGGVLVEVKVDRFPDETDRETEAERAESDARIEATIARLRSEERYWPDLVPNRFGAEHPLWTWPLVNDRSGAFDPWSVRNFVDQDRVNPGQMFDYRCGDDRLYDNHAGIDISLWPFPWREKARGSVMIVAAAPGQILETQDGNPDNNCEFGGPPRNRVVLVHADGTISIYSHMKTGSVTTKAVGQLVARGEYLGRVASSGQSTAPHLHFETKDPDGVVLEPYAGACNTTPVGTESWWAYDPQPQYRPYRLVELATHSAAPVIPPCPGVEDPNFERLFSNGDTVRIGVYHTDPIAGDRTDFSVVRADGTLQWSFSILHDEVASRHESHWQFTLPDILPAPWRGAWKIVATVHEVGEAPVAHERKFWVGALFADDFERRSLTDAGWTVPIVLP